MSFSEVFWACFAALLFYDILERFCDSLADDLRRWWAKRKER